MPPEEIQALKVAAARVGVPMAEHARAKLRNGMTLPAEEPTALAADLGEATDVNLGPGQITYRAPDRHGGSPPLIRSMGRLPTSTIRKVGYEPG